MPPTNVNVSMECFNELANALEAQGQKVNPENPITVTKDVKIKGPIDYRQVTIRKDILEQVVKVYEPKMKILTSENGNENLVCDSDSLHLINFLDDVYQYIFKGVKPKEKEQHDTNEKPKPKTENKSGWN